jgi:hypothetical protein
LSRIRTTASLLDLLRRPSVSVVMVTRRRSVDYAAFFGPADRDGRRASPVQTRVRAAADGSSRTYTPVRTA